ncbi:MAG TPA: twin-arginine translocation signal domain-containing protein, partial [Terriglobales bacterium]|nr:twin-arginine translocation signal domain-containing protein [Terriglobales bacterium]
MLIKTSAGLPSAEITPPDTYLNRRKFLAGVGLTAAAATGIGVKELMSPSSRVRAADKIAGLQKSPFSTSEKLTPMN